MLLDEQMKPMRYKVVIGSRGSAYRNILHHCIDMKLRLAIRQPWRESIFDVSCAELWKRLS